MAISIAQYVDLLFKKLQGVAKTANANVKSASNESIASPAFLRGDIVWMQADQIGNTAGAISGIANARTGANAVECVGDTTVPPIGSVRPTWLSNVQYWIPQEFGSTWLPKVFVGPSGEANIEATGTQIFAAGSGGTGEYFFDTQAGVLNFIGETIPTVLSAANVVYISGYEYVGAIGVTNNPGNVNLGNLAISNTTISANIADGNITLGPDGNGTVIIDTVTGLIIPTGNTAQRPVGETGAIRFNTSNGTVEVYDGIQWKAVGSDFASITAQTIDGDGSTATFTLDESTTAAAIIVAVNGVVQQPDVAYSVTGNSITFAEAPQVSDTVDVRFTAAVTTVSSITNATGNAEIAVTDAGIANISTCDSLQLPSYTVADAANVASPAAGQIIYVTDGDSGNPCLAVYSSGAWKRVSLGANIST